MCIKSTLCKTIFYCILSCKCSGILYIFTSFRHLDSVRFIGVYEEIFGSPLLSIRCFTKHMMCSFLINLYPPYVMILPFLDFEFSCIYVILFCCSLVHFAFCVIFKLCCFPVPPVSPFP